MTDAGAVPDDWVVDALGAHVAITSGMSPSLFRFTTTGVPYFKVEQLNNSGKYLGTQSTPYHIAGGPSVPRNSIVFAKRGAAIALNKVRILDDDAFMDTNLMALTPGDSLDSEYLYYALSHVGLWRLADTTSVPQINNKHIQPLALARPSLAEQRVIAKTLGDVDALLDGLTRLIAKKRNLKLAAMQQLLTGRTRLPTFSDAWSLKCLEEIADVDPENLREDTSPDLTFNYIALEDVDQGCLRSSSQQVFGIAPSRARRRLRLNDVLVATVRPSRQSHLLFAEQPGVWVCSTGFAVLRCRQGLSHPGFVFQSMFGVAIAKQIDEMIAGSNYPAISSRDVRALRIDVPCIEEQAAIAAVLSDMDAELAALEARRAKTQALRQAMMQSLLTGRIRLLTPEPAYA